MTNFNTDITANINGFFSGNSEINAQTYNSELRKLIEEVSSTEYYIGISESFVNIYEAIWQIKKISKTGDVWTIQFPNGDQSFNYIWNNRAGYTYA